MGREHTPRPGATWERRLDRVEQLVDDDAPPEPGPKPLPAPNRAARRAIARANRKEHRRA